MLPVLHEELLHSRLLLPGLRRRLIVQAVSLDVRCVDVSAAVAEVGVKMPQIAALIVANAGASAGSPTPVAVLVG